MSFKTTVLDKGYVRSVFKNTTNLLFFPTFHMISNGSIVKLILKLRRREILQAGRWGSLFFKSEGYYINQVTS